MATLGNKSKLHPDAFWLQMNELFAASEKKNLIEAINKSDSEKFYLFTSMMQITNTLNKIKVREKK